jgi:hypothetical protein
MNRFTCASAITALLVAGCGCLSDPPSNASLRYRSPLYDITFSLPPGWQGYSVMTQTWGGQTYSPATDSLVATERGPMIVLRHPQWKAGAPYQDIPVLVFTREQWAAYRQGRFEVGAGGFQFEIGHNLKFVFTISTRYNADDSVQGWKQVDEIVERNRAANAPSLFPRL